MVNSLLVAASLKSIEDILKESDVPYEINKGDAYTEYMEVWDAAGADVQNAEVRKARPAIRRIFTKEPYIFEKDGKPLIIDLNDPQRKLHEESFGEILIARPDLDWKISISVKSDAKVPANMPVADRDIAKYMDKIVNVYNEIDDFGFRIFNNPCSNEYFEDVNEILQRVSPTDRNTWAAFLTDADKVYDLLITPMLRAVGKEVKRLCAGQPEAPQKFLDYFYGTIDYYYISPIDEVGVTRIGAVNSRRGLGRIPNNRNLFTPQVEFPTKLLEVRFANGKYGELSRDTLQFWFDNGWTVCVTVLMTEVAEGDRRFDLNVYLPMTPFGSYRDQVEWEK